jgi:DNA (cytosine-5)-methyltransferase 3A
LLKETKPKYFIFETVARMEKVDCEEITAALGVEPKSVNSNLLSFQNRDRLYWSNIDFDMPKAKGISFQNYKSTDSDYLDMFRVNRTPSREGMWGDGVNGKCKNVTHADKINCLTVKQDRWSNSGLVEHGNFCRYLTTEELEAAQTVPNGYCKMLTKNQAESVLGNAWTVDVIAHILSFIEKENK